MQFITRSPSCSQLILFLYISYDMIEQSHMIIMGPVDASDYNGSSSMTQKLLHDIAVMKYEHAHQLKSTTDMIKDVYKLCEEVPKVCHSESEINEFGNQIKKHRFKRRISSSSKANISRYGASTVFLLGLEEIKMPDRRKKRKDRKKRIIPICFFVLDKNRKKRVPIIRRTFKDKLLSTNAYEENKKQEKEYQVPYNIKMFEAITDKTPELSKSKNAHTKSVKFYSDLNSILTEANRTLNHISTLAKYDSVEMPDDMKKPLVAVLLKRISDIFTDIGRLE